MFLFHFKIDVPKALTYFSVMKRKQIKQIKIIWFSNIMNIEIGCYRVTL